MMETILFRSDNLLVKKVGAYGSAECIVTFDSFTDYRTLDRPGFGEKFFQQHQLDAIHILSRDNDWYQYQEMRDALAALRVEAQRYGRVITYGSSMGGYAALRFASAVDACVSIAISPQFSINPSVVPFENRWRDEADRIEFLWEGDPPPIPHHAVVFYDPHDKDAQHFSLIAEQFNTIGVKLRYAGHPAGAYLAEAGLISQTILGIIRGEFDQSDFERQVRVKRRLSGQYLFTLSNKVPSHRKRLRLELAQLAVNAQPNNAGYISNLATRLAEVGRLVDAQREHERAITMSSRHPIILHHYASFLRQVGEFSRARVIAQEVLAIAPNVRAFQKHLEQIDDPEGLERTRAQFAEAQLTTLDDSGVSQPTPTELDEVAHRRSSIFRLGADLLNKLLRRGTTSGGIEQPRSNEPTSSSNTTGAALQPSTKPVPPPYSASIQRHIYLTQTAPSGEVDLVLVGGSLAHLWPEALWHPWTVYNFGVVGDQIQNVLWRLHAAELGRVRPKNVVVAVGTNDLISGDCPVALAAGVRAVSSQVNTVWPTAKVLVLEILPCGLGFTFRAHQRMQANTLIGQLATTINVDQEITCGFADQCPNYTSDDIHLTDQGYHLLTKLMMGQFVKVELGKAEAREGSVRSESSLG
jgi:tetratricopeptide (TPR) repeat protein